MPATVKSRRLKGSRAETAGECLRSLGLTGADPLQIMRRIDAGLSYAAIERLQAVVKLPIDELARIVDVPSRTLHRRKTEGRFSSAESERLVRFASLFDKALLLFDGDLDATRQWLQRPQPALTDEKPLDLVRSEVGAREVEALIGRLEHGVYP